MTLKEAIESGKPIKHPVYDYYFRGKTTKPERAEGLRMPEELDKTLQEQFAQMPVEMQEQCIATNLAEERLYRANRKCLDLKKLLKAAEMERDVADDVLKQETQAWSKALASWGPSGRE